MSNLPFIVELKRTLPETDWHWVVAGLHQDSLVWSELRGDLGSRVLEKFQDNSEAYLPGVISLLALGHPDPLETVELINSKPATEVYHLLSADGVTNLTLTPLGEAGFQALELLELWSVASSWEGLESRLSNMSPSTAACLFSLLHNPETLLTSLLSIGRFALAAHALLSNPAIHTTQADILARVLEKTSPIDILPMLRHLFIQRPVLAVSLAQKILHSSWWEHIKDQKVASPHVTLLNEQYNHIVAHLFRAEIYRLAAQPNLAIPILQETIRLSRHLQAEVAAQLANVAAENDDWKSALSAWEQASHLNPDSMDHLGGFLMALVDDNQHTKAETQISEHPIALEYVNGQPVNMLVARAELALQSNQLEKAQTYALQALESLQEACSNPSSIDIDPRTPVTLARLFLDTSMPQKAVLSAQAAIHLKPDYVEGCSWLAKSLLASGRLDDAIEHAHLAVCLAPDRLDLRASLVGMLEAAQDWGSVYEERKILIERTANPSSVSLQKYAESALNAGQFDVVSRVCGQLLDLDSQDGEAIAILALSVAEQGQESDALAVLNQAIQDIPSHPSPWLAIAQIHREAGDKAKSLDTLRAATQAVPEEPRILLDLGKAYLDEGSLTQALAPLRQGAHLLQADHSDQADRYLLSQAALYLGQTLYQLGHLDDAYHALETGYRAAPYTPEIANTYAQVLLAVDEPQDALLPLSTVIQSNPHDPQPYLDYARCILRMDDNVQPENYQVALKYLGLAADISPNLPEIRALSAELMAASGDLQPAMNAYRKALDTSLAQDPAWQIRLWLGLGKVALDLGQIETAVAALQEASLVGPENPDVKRFLCEAYDAAGLVENAFEAAQSTRDLAAGDIDTLIWFAQKAHDLQNRPGVFLADAHQEAVQALQQATRQATHQAHQLVRLGEIQMQLGEIDNAHLTFRRLIGEGDEEIPGLPLNASPTDLHRAALGLLEIGDAHAAVSCLENALQQDIESYPKNDHQHRSKTPLRLQLLIDLAYALRIAGQHLACLQTIDQAILLDGSNVDLYIMKADLLANLEDDKDAQIEGTDRLELASEALQTALAIDPQNPALHIRTTLVLRKMGEVSKAMKHAEQARLISPSLPEDKNQFDTLLTSSLLAADLARAMLQYDRATEILASCTDYADNCELNLQIEFYCLRAELNLEQGEYDQATIEIAQAIELAPEDPGLLALQSRLSLRKSAVSTEGSTLFITSSAREIFNLAIDNFNRLNPGIDSVRMNSPSQAVVVRDQAAQRRLAKAAMELRYWETALEFTRQVVKAAPDEPDPHLQLACFLVHRAEYQRNCQALQVITHAPGSEALSENAFGEFQFAIQIAEDLMLQSIQPSSPRSRDIHSNVLSIAPQQIIKLWQVRGTAVFCPNAQSAEELAALTADPDNVAAHIACLHSVGDLTTAGRVASQHAHNPSVLAQLAVSLAETKPRQALVAVQGALEAFYSPEPASDDSTTQQRNDTRAQLLSSIDIPMVFALLGQLSYMQNETDEDQSTAIQATQKALSIWPDEPRWHTLAAEMILGSSNPGDSVASESAAAHLEKAIQLDPEHARSYRMLGNLYEARGNHSSALDLLEKASELAPLDADIWLQLAQVHHSSGNRSEALRCAEKAAALAPRHTKPLILLADMELSENKPEAAQARAQTALEIEPDNPDALVLTARALKALEQPSEAIALLEKALPIVSDPLPLHLEYIQLIQKARGGKVALEAAKDLSSRYADDSRVLSLLAEMLEKDGQVQPAVQAAQRALRCKNCLDALNKEELAYLHYNLGRLLSQTGQLDQSIHQLIEAIDKNPGYVEPYLELGHVHQQRRQHAQALQAFSQAIDAAPGDSRPYYHAGLALKESKDYLEAEKMLRKASELAPEDVSIHRLLGAVVALNLVHNRRQTSLAR